MTYSISEMQQQENIFTNAFHVGQMKKYPDVKKMVSMTVSFAILMVKRLLRCITCSNLKLIFTNRGNQLFKS